MMGLVAPKPWMTFMKLLPVMLSAVSKLYALRGGRRVGA